MFSANCVIEGNVKSFVFKDSGDECVYVFNLHRKKYCIKKISTAAVPTGICPNYSKSIWHMIQHCQRLPDGAQLQSYGTVQSTDFSRFTWTSSHEVLESVV